MSEFFKNYDVDADEAEHGKWFDFGDGVEFKLRRFNSKKSKTVMNHLYKPYANSKNMADDVAENLLAEHLAKAIVVSWKGITHKKETVSVPEKAGEREKLVKEWMLKYPDLRDEIFSLSQTLENFLKTEEDEEEKN